MAKAEGTRKPRGMDRNSACGNPARGYAAGGRLRLRASFRISVAPVS